MENISGDEQLDEDEARDAEALRLHEAHLSYRQIAAQLGWLSHTSAIAAVKRARAAESVEDNEMRRAIMDAQLHAAARRLLVVMAESSKRSRQADLDRIVRATDAYVRVCDRMAKLWGLDAPAKRAVEVSIINEEAVRSERLRLDALLTAAGVDVSALPQPEELAEWIAAQAQAVIAADVAKSGTSPPQSTPADPESDGRVVDG